MNDPTFWTAVGALAAVAVFGGTLLLHMLKSAEDKGHLRARVEALEKGQGDIISAGKLVATLDVTVGILSKAVTNLDNTVNNILQGKLIPLRQRSQGRD